MAAGAVPQIEQHDRRDFARAIAWCRDQQMQAHKHRRKRHRCDHPQCTPENNLRWLLDSFAEEILTVEASHGES
jgi:hypothetical protein